MVKQTTKLQQVRVRDIQGVAKIEVNKEDISKLHSPGILDEITHKLKLIGFSEVIIDSEGYKPGKINVIAD